MSGLSGILFYETISSTLPMLLGFASSPPTWNKQEHRLDLMAVTPERGNENCSHSSDLSGIWFAFFMCYGFQIGGK